MQEYIEKLNIIKETAFREIAEAQDSQMLENLRVKYLGKKSELSNILKSVGNISVEERKTLGMTSNTLKNQITEMLEQNKLRIIEMEKQRRFNSEAVDVTMPGLKINDGRLHPLKKVMKEIETIFLGFGFTIADGPEIETDYYNFEALNIPAHHPARDMHDTFYITNNILLRTHTSPVQVRVMENQRPPVKIIAPGKVYRRDSDVSHIPMFHQVEGLWVDKGITFAHLQYILTEFMQKLFYKSIKLRFRPSFFPFTEPSTEVDISCVICGGSGCRVCKNTGWLEVLGAGMVDPEVFKFVDYDPEIYTGFAFGLGVDRIAMLKYKINDLRLFPENDIRFLRQF
ncbi:MAG TPA: phenylalanine--tRNA ligase subunit alpha [bacterium]|nr:phenylalanine--tRNA ligase subunit alpha [bacterium]